MFEPLPTPATKNLHESTWDHHGSYQWTYFEEDVKKRISFFLSERLQGKNIEVGGGWYLSYPNSTVVDLSSVCLEKNPATEKLQFDLDEIGEGRRLPYSDSSFDSATFISSWQYLKHPHEVLSELERILKPGAEMYLINGQGAGLTECMQGFSRSRDLAQFFNGLGYDTLMENIPTAHGDVTEFQSLCVAMPDVDLFGKVPSRIKNKEIRVTQNDQICEKPVLFTDKYTDWELSTITRRLGHLSTYPITAYSQEYLRRVEEFSQECYTQTGRVPLLFVEHSFEPELAMLVQPYLMKEHNFLYAYLFVMGNMKLRDAFDKPVQNLLQQYELSFTRHMNYFNEPTPELLLSHFLNINSEEELRSRKEELKGWIAFIASMGLNSFTRDLQTQMYSVLKPKIKDLDLMVQKRKTFGCYLAASEHKQKRRVDNLIETKQKILTQGIPTVGTATLDYYSMMPMLREWIKGE